MMGMTLVKRGILSAALLGSLVMFAGATAAKANDRGPTSQFSFSLGIGNGNSGYGHNGFYGGTRYDNNNYRDYDRSFTRDARRDSREREDRNGNHNSWFDNDRNRESDRGSGWGRR